MKIQNRGGKKKQNTSYYSGVLNQAVVKERRGIFRIDSGLSMIIGLDPLKIKNGNKCTLSGSKRKKQFKDLIINLLYLYYYLLFYY